jgi:hypothetical protein
MREEGRGWPHALKRGETWPWEAADEETDKIETPFRPTVLMQRVSELLEQSAEPLPKKRIEDAVQGRASYIRQAVEVLVLEGHVEIIKDGRALFHKIVKPFRDEPRPFVPTSSHLVPDEVHATSSIRPPPTKGDEVRDEVATRWDERSSAHLVPDLEAASECTLDDLDPYE